MKLNINRFARDPYDIDWNYSNVDIDSNNNIHSITLTVYSAWHDIDSIYIINSDDSRTLDTWNWEIETYSSYPWAAATKTITSTSGIKGFRFADVGYNDSSPSGTYYGDIFFDFTITPRISENTTYITKTSATAVLEGNVVNNLATWDYNNAPSIAAVRNYLSSGSFVHTTDIQNIVADALLAAHPIGSIEVNVSGTNPGTYLGGTWEAFGTGRTLVGVDTSDSNFDTVEETGGSKTHSHNYGLKAGGYYCDTVLTESAQDGVFTWDSNNNRTLMTLNSSVGSQSVNVNGGNATSSKSANMAHYQAIANTSYTSTLQPYVTVYFWKRTA